MPDGSLPIEVGIEKARDEILTMLNAIAQKYSLPSAVITLLLESMVNAIKNTTYESILSNYNLSPSANGASNNAAPTAPPITVNVPAPKHNDAAPIANEESSE